nr:MAG TPA: hypothetical protein [Microviridae sp.]
MVNKIDLYNEIKFDSNDSSYYIERGRVNPVVIFRVDRKNSLYWYIHAIFSLPYRSIRKKDLKKKFIV